MNRAVIELGSNLNSEENILMARFCVSKAFAVLKESAFQKTKPVDHPLAEEFMNGCIYIQTPLDLEALRGELKKLEKEMGRDHEALESVPHPIDFDVVVWNEQLIDKNFYNRSFLKESVLELLPGLKF